MGYQAMIVLSVWIAIAVPVFIMVYCMKLKSRHQGPFSALEIAALMALSWPGLLLLSATCVALFAMTALIAAIAEVKP